MDEIRIGEKTYISSKKAAEITGYAKDYVGQLCREGHVEAKMVGRSWYVFEPSIRAHRFGEAVETPEEVIEDQQETPVSVPEPVQEPRKTEDLPSLTWQRPSYTAEVPATIPEIQDVPRGTVNLLSDEARKPDIAALSDMQRAWEAWFELKRGREEAQEAPVAVQKLIETSEDYVEEEDIDEDMDVVEEEYEPTEAIDDEQNAEEEEIVPFRRIPAPPVAQSVRSEPVIYDIAPVQAPVRTHIAPVETSHEVYVAERMPVQKKGGGSKAGTVVTRALLVALSLVAIAVGLIGSGLAQPYLKSVHVSGPLESVVNVLVGERVLENK